MCIVTKEWLSARLSTTDKERVLGRALLALYNAQTLSEQSSHATRINNGVGFSKPDAKVGTKCALMFKSKGSLDAWMLKVWLMEVKGFPRICKYANQLNDIARQRAADKALLFDKKRVVILNDLILT